MQAYFKLFLSFLLLILILTGCAAESPTTVVSSATSGLPEQPADTPLPSPTPDPPTAMPTPIPPTGTPLSTPTPMETQVPSATPTPPLTTILFTGAIVPGRCVQAAIDEQGNADFLYEDVRDLISSADIAVGTLNAALSDYPPHTGCIKTFVLVGSSNNADALANAGFDVMSVATNHIKNCGLSTCGDRAFLDTMDNLKRVGILPVGAGHNLQEATQPVVLDVNGIRFGFISLGEVEALAFAGENTPGIAPLPSDFAEAEANLRSAIRAVRAISDVVITMPHWGSDYSDTPNYRQLFFDQVAVEAGADLVIGNHPHVIQGMREIEGVPVFYSLGSFVFDQDWSRETQQGIVVVVTFEGMELRDYQVIPVHIEGNGHIQVAESPEAEEILGRFQALSVKLK
jgi:poly-gamma-glutamate capsule biosynthesis protein CapA/YwtB (metallophosphatase superfamily)